MHSRFWSLSLALSLAALGAVPAARAAVQPRRKPNLLFLHTDQQRQDTLRAYGNTAIRTPNLDALAERSFVFNAFYVSHPLCTPSRATMLTGLYPGTHGSWENSIPLRASVPILTEMLGDPEYVTAYFGKWHLGDEIFKQRGFSQFESTEDGYTAGYSKGRDPEQRSGYYRFLVENGIQPDTPGGHSRDLANRLPKQLSKPAYLARKATEFLDQARNRPFVLYLSFLEPHAFADHSWGPPFKNVNDDLYDPSTIEIPATFREPMDPSVSYQKRQSRVSAQRGEFAIAYPRTEQELRQAKARYWGLITLVDEMVGRVLARLRELGLEEDTIVVFTSDHGEMMGDHRLVSKEFTYEEAIKVPLLISVPGHRDRMIRIARPVGQVDLVPTLLELMGKPVPGHIQGRSWAAALRAGLEPTARDVFVVSDVTGFAADWNKDHVTRHRTVITSEGWKLSVNDLGEGELYHLAGDPQERRNLYASPEQRKRVQDLLARLRRWQHETGDTVDLDLDQPWPKLRR
jgi:arylsulfatase A-like enzyme